MEEYLSYDALRMTALCDPDNLALGSGGGGLIGCKITIMVHITTSPLLVTTTC